jgi:hypothetical protein
VLVEDEARDVVVAEDELDNVLEVDVEEVAVVLVVNAELNEDVGEELGETVDEKEALD